MRFATYNVCYGFNGSSFWRNAWNHAVMHATQSRSLVLRQIKHLDDAIELACSDSPDILCLQEIPGTLFGKEVEAELRKRGYQAIATGEGGEGHMAKALRFTTVLASRHAGEALSVDIPHMGKWRGGGGACALRLPSEKLAVLGIHCAVRKSLLGDQLTAIAKFMNDHISQGRRVVVLGDFNMDLADLRRNAALGTLSWEGIERPTFRYPLVSKAAIDHILWSPGFTARDIKTISGTSDHHMLSCELIPQ